MPDLSGSIAAGAIGIVAVLIIAILVTCLVERHEKRRQATTIDWTGSNEP